MKGVILSGGRGSRLYPLTVDLPKPLIPIAGQPILFHILDEFAAAGVDDVCVVTGADPSPFETALAPRGASGAVCVPQPQPRGIADALYQAAEFVGQGPCAVALGDNLVGAARGAPGVLRPQTRPPSPSLRGWVEAFRQAPNGALVAVARVADPRRFGVAVLDPAGHVVALEEKPLQPRSDLALIGRYLFGPEIFAAIERIEPSARSELELTDAIEALRRGGGEVRAAAHAGPWEDTGTLPGLLRANRRLLADTPGEGETVPLFTGLTLDRARIIPPVWIGRDCVIEQAVVGPYASLGDGVIVSGTRVCDSVLLDHCRVEGEDWVLRDSLVGPGACVRSTSWGRQARGLLLGRQAVATL